MNRYCWIEYLENPGRLDRELREERERLALWEMTGIRGRVAGEIVGDPCGRRLPRGMEWMHRERR